MGDMKLQLWHERKMLNWDTQVQYELSHVCSYIPLYYLSALQFSSSVFLSVYSLTCHIGAVQTGLLVRNVNRVNLFTLYL